MTNFIKVNNWEELQKLVLSQHVVNGVPQHTQRNITPIATTLDANNLTSIVFAETDLTDVTPYKDLQTRLIAEYDKFREGEVNESKTEVSKVESVDEPISQQAGTEHTTETERSADNQ